MAKTTVGSRGREAQRPGEISRAGWKDILTRTFGEIKADRVPIVSAGSAFYAFLALFPALIALITVYGLVADPAMVEQQVSDMAQVMGSDIAEVIERPLTNAATGGGLTVGLIASLAGLLWSASGGVKALIESINVAYDEVDERSFLKKRGLALLLTLGGIVFVVLAVALIAVVPIVLDTLRLGTVGTVLANVIRWPLLAVMAVLALGVLYKVGPDRHNPQFRWVNWGAITATALWLLGSGLFSLYISNFSNYDETYGALAGVIVVLLWLFLSAFIVILGAELNSEMEAQTRRDSTVGEPRPRGQRGAVKADRLGDSVNAQS